MGRRRIEIKKISDHRARRATFTKRKAGLFKKAWEFGVLTGSKVYLVIEDERRSKHSFTTDKEDVHLNCQSVKPENRVGPAHFEKTQDSPAKDLPLDGSLVPSMALSQAGESWQLDYENSDTSGYRNVPDADLCWTDDFTREIVKDCIQVANSLFDPSLLLDDCAPDTINQCIQSLSPQANYSLFADTIASEMANDYSQGTNTAADLSRMLPPTCSPYRFGGDSMSSSGYDPSQDSTISMDWLQQMPMLPPAPSPISSQWLV